VSRQPAWWEAFFSGLWLDVQRRANSAEQTQRDTARILELLAVDPGAHLLDLPCGDGRVALELAAPLLADARRHARERGLAVAWEQRDMRALPWHDAFDGAFCWWASFGYFDDAGNGDFLGAVQRALRPGARFAFDCAIAETFLPDLPERSRRQHGDIDVLVEWYYDARQGRVDRDFTLIRGEIVEHRRISMRLYTQREVDRLLRAAGFRAVAWHPLDGDGPFQIGTRERPIVVATK
jgi:cyclopropane fatty-acyl-phospholipid synthase-like methyltransferase